MNIGILTSSRADFGIYLPLLAALRDDPYFNLELIVFGTHLSHFHGYTVSQVEEQGIPIASRVENLLQGDSQEAIATAIALTQMKFAALWADLKSKFDIIFCLGDRYEMFAAVSAGVPFNIRFAHIHGGETTLGAIDNIFRHSLSLFSSLHFTATEEYARRVKEITGKDKDVYNVGALGLDNVGTMTLYTPRQFQDFYGIDLNKPTVLVTYHPETVRPDLNLKNTAVLAAGLAELPYQVIVSLPNADTTGASMREVFLELSRRHANIVCNENLGTKGYFTCLKYCKFLLGNSSSGIIEAASFNRYVINLGHRQEGRATSGNVSQLPEFSKDDIINACRRVMALGDYTGDNIYYGGGATMQIVNALKNTDAEKL